MQREDVLARFQKAINSAIIGNVLIAVIIYPFFGMLRTFLIVGGLALISWSFLAYSRVIHERIEFIMVSKEKEKKVNEDKKEEKDVKIEKNEVVSLEKEEKRTDDEDLI